MAEGKNMKLSYGNDSLLWNVELLIGQKLKGIEN